MSSPPNWLLKFSSLISNVFNPMVSLLVFFIFSSLKHHSAAGSLQRLLPVLLIIILPVTIWIFYNIKKGKYRDANVSDRKARMSLYLFLELVLALYLIYKYVTTSLIDFQLFFLLMLLVVMHLSNYFIKSSMHTAFNLFAAALFTTENPLLGLIWFMITITVALSRLLLKRHTAAEVLSGFVLATAVSSLFLYFTIQNSISL